MIKVGFTGTQNGMTGRQASAVETLLLAATGGGAVHRHMAHNFDAEAHHGDCIGADAQFHDIARACKMNIVIHPCDIMNKRAFCTNYFAMREIKKPLVRNHDIVDESTCLIAAPKEEQMQLRSGTWATVRYAQKQGRPIAIAFPSGVIIYDGMPWIL